MQSTIRRLLWLVLFTVVSSSPGGSQSGPAAQAAQGEEQELQGRVQEYYSLLQVGRWAEAERYLTEDSKENFRNQQKSPFVGFEIKSVKLEPDGKTATTLVLVQTLVPAFSLTPMPVSSTTSWRLVQGAWYAVIPKPAPNAWKAAFSPPPGGSAAKQVPHLEELKFKGHTYYFAVIPPGKVKVVRFPFKNVTDHAVTITEVVTGCDCLKAKIDKKRYEPGESGELAVEFDPSDYAREYAQTIVVRTDPGGLVTFLNVKGYVIPPPNEASKPAQAPNERKEP